MNASGSMSPPGRPLSDEDVARLASWNDTAHPYPDQATVHELFDLQADATPDRTALVHRDERLTFGELQRRSNGLAHLLIEKGVGPGISVGVAMHRSADAIVAMLAIMKAGGAYLPLDPSYPNDRLALMVDDADVGLILTGPDVDGFPATRAESIDVRRFDASAYPSSTPPNRTTPDDPLYVTYTSGSTGRPNGVVGIHRGAINRFNWAWETYPYSEGEVCCQKTSLNFLDHLAETWAPLLNGHRLVIIPDEVAQDGGRFVDILAEHRIERLVTVPSLMATLLRAVPDMGTKLSHLRYCSLSGERLTVELANAVEAVLPGTVLLNLYGMSEGSADATWYDHRWGTESDSFPIGRPIHNVQVYVLDADRQSVPVGEPGEIYLAGVGLAKGYLGRPDLTAERFPPNPFVDDPGARMYRSGDLGRWLPDGMLEFIGRVDQQVKIRGIRIELGEIEAAARSLDEVTEAVVTAPEFGLDRRLVAYLTPAPGAKATTTAIRGALASRLPGYMVPARIIMLDRFPLTPSGKIDRSALPDPIGERPAGASPYARPHTDIERSLVGIWQELLFIDRIGVNDSFFDLGGDSLLVVLLRAQLQAVFGVALAAPRFFENRTIRQLAGLIEELRAPTPDRSEMQATAGLTTWPFQAIGTDVAIIGMAGRFPGAPDLDRLWDMLASGAEGMRRLTDEELRTWEPHFEKKARDPDFVPVVGTLDDVEMFDADFFGIQPGEARTLDPQHRIWFEVAWSALEHGGYAPGKSNHRIGVFAGSYMNTYTMYNLLHDRAAVEEFVRLQGPSSLLQSLNNEPDYLPTRTSHLLDLRGPAINVQTACSTSLVAVALACRAIASGDCEMALAGGVTVLLPQAQGYYFQSGGIRSVDGHCRPFDAAGTGTIFTSGVGAVLLKGLHQALADGDNVLAVIKGAAMNNDGAHKASYMAPSIDGQVGVIIDAQRRAGVDPATIRYVEAHGTATPLGDPIEVAALSRAFRRNGADAQHSVALGSIKSNIGHTDAAAGVAGLIKAVLALTHEAIPATLHFETPNPEIDFDDSPFYVPDRLVPWPRRSEPRRAGISSFGVGGTNAHVVLEEGPAPNAQVSARPRHLLMLSARTTTALKAMREALADHLEVQRPPLADVAHTLTVGRADFAYRMAVVASDVVQAVEALRTYRAEPTRLELDAPEVVMMFPGQGSQFVGMGRELYEHEPVYREALDRCATTLLPLLGLDLRDVLYPADEADDNAAQQLTQTGLAQPAIFAVSYSTARLWLSWGVRPGALVGHSVGEYVAAVLAGVFTLEDALAIIAARARMMQSLPGGSMRAVRLSPDELAKYLGDGVDLAAVNTPSLSVVSGPHDAVGRFTARLKEAGLDTVELHTSHAFHSRMMEPILDGFREVIASVERRPPRMPIVSTVTGKLLTEAEATDPSYWADQVRRPVRFSDAVLTLHRERGRVYLEVGPGVTLSGAVMQHPSGEDGARIAVIDSLGHPGKRPPALASILEGLGKLWAAGVWVDRAVLYAGERRRRVPLPTYPFERQRHWVEPPPLSGQAPAPPAPRETGDNPTADTAETRDGISLDAVSGETSTADELARIIAGLSGLDVATIDRSESFANLGLDSLFLTQVSSQIRRQYGVPVPLELLLSSISDIEALAVHIDGASGGNGDDAGATGSEEPSELADPASPVRVPVLPNVTRFLLERGTPHPEHWNMATLLTPTRPMAPDITRGVVRALLRRHDALRLRIGRDDDGYTSWIAPPDEVVPFAHHDLTDLDEREQTEAVERRAAELQANFDLTNGPLIGCEQFDLGARGQRLLVVVHHFALDQLSWRPFWDDFVQLYVAHEQGRGMRAPHATPFGSWAQALQRYADSEAVRVKAGMWRDLPWERVRPVPLDYPDGVNTNRSAEFVELSFTVDETTELLRNTPGVRRKVDLILMALAHALAAWTDSDSVLIDMMGHGRDDDIADDLDVMDTVGFFISYTPLVLRVPREASDRSLSAQLEPLVASRLSYDLLRHMTSDAQIRRSFSGLPRAHVLLNYYGNLNEPDELPRSSMFKAASESAGNTHHPEGIRYYPLAIPSRIYRDQLQLHFVYSSNLHDRATIERLTEAFREQLNAAITEASG